LSCQSNKPDGKKKGDDPEATTLRFFIETNPDATGRQTEAVVGRANPFKITVEDQPFLTEIFIKEATLVENMGLFEIRLQFDRQGTWLLEQFTAGNKRKHFAIYSQFSDARWLAAPLITRTISDGVFTFTPDASPEEIERIVRGLKNIASEVNKEW
jgi:hypothetical protein